MSVLSALVAAAVVASCSNGPSRHGAPTTSAQSSPSTSVPTNSTNRFGYITVSGGIKLAYDLTLPAASGRFPVALQYNDYGVGEDNASENAGSDAGDLLAAGFAVLGVDQPGSGCSGGINNIADVNEWGQAGAQVVEWAAAQPWSTGHVGMFGSSWTGMTQIGVAGFRPKGLDAITPFHVAIDLYRDVAYPGGIYDAAFIDEYASALVQMDAQTAQAGISRGDQQCADDFHAHVLANTRYSIATGSKLHRYDDTYWQTSPGQYANRIEIPVLGCQSWQDGLVSSRATEMYYNTFNQATTWFVGMNGGHGVCESSTPLTMMVSFLRYYVAGVDDGWPATPHITILHEVAASNSSPAWTSTYPNWSDVMAPVTLYFHGDGALTNSPATGEQAATFSGPAPSQSGTWTNPTPGASISFTTPPLADDVDLFGPASANLWLSSTSADTDIEVIISDVRPDGQEQYVEAGWLDIAQRALAPPGTGTTETSVLRPYHTYAQADLEPLTPGLPVYAQVELLPFEHVFRKGSSIRITIDSAMGTVQPGGPWGLTAPNGHFADAIYAGPRHDSESVLGVIPGAAATKPLPTCHDTAGEPCRPNATPVPEGSTLAVPNR